MKKAEQEAAFTSLVLARAKLGENTVSEDLHSRMGEREPGDWRSLLADQETSAVRSGFEGFLALKIEDLKAELSRQNEAAAWVRKRIEAFSDHVPAFGGVMGRQRDWAMGELQDFHSLELDVEEKLLGTVTASMHGRVNDRLYEESAEYRNHRDRRNRLTAVLDDAIGPAADLGRTIADHLDDAVRHRQSEATNLVMAAANAAVPVAKTRTVTDSNGDTHSETYIEIEDHSAGFARSPNQR